MQEKFKTVGVDETSSELEAKDRRSGARVCSRQVRHASRQAARQKWKGEKQSLRSSVDTDEEVRK